MKRFIIEQSDQEFHTSHSGLAPIGVYLGNEGWCLACELREGKLHSQKEFIYVLERVIPRARKLTELPLLLRMDSAHDALENRAFCVDEGVDFLIKWNPRQQDEQHWLAQAEKHGVWDKPREGKRVALFEVHEDQTLSAYAERWVKSVKDECLSKLILFGEASLRHAVRHYLTHYHGERNHQGKDNVVPFATLTTSIDTVNGFVACRERLGALLKY